MTYLFLNRFRKSKDPLYHWLPLFLWINSFFLLYLMKILKIMKYLSFSVSSFRTVETTWHSYATIKSLFVSRSNLSFRVTSNYISLVIKQNGESENGCYKKTMHVKFSEKQTFLIPWNVHFQIRLLPYCRR